MGLSLPFGRNGSASGSVSRSGDHVQGVVTAAKSPSAAGGLGWRATGTFDDGRASGTRLEGEIRQVASWGEIGGGASATADGRNLAARVYGAGSVVFLGGARPRFAGPVGDGFALVDTGAPDVQITVENVLVGATDAKGELHVQNGEPRVLFTVASGNDLAVVDTDFYSTLAVVPDAFIYADRPIYKPGDKIGFRGVLRQPDSYLARLFTPRKGNIAVSLLTADNRKVSVFDPSIRGKTDRFLFRFRKPR